YYQDLANRFDAGEMLSKDSIELADSIKFFTDNKRVVYGGGGIMPDIFVPLDTSENSPYLQKLFASGVFNDFMTTYVDQNRAAFEQYKTFESFNTGFSVNDALLNRFVTFAEGKGVKKDAAGLSLSDDFIRVQLKALFARQLFRYDGYFHVINSKNNAYTKAIQVIQDGTYDKMKIRD
ncbi:MAG: peptidase S41, partial [Bacteroidota bacterium]|nr:peptidase S41 [Bacteroidota bacterium]